MVELGEQAIENVSGGLRDLIVILMGSELVALVSVVKGAGGSANEI